ncbi:MAG: glucose 1-dehydrogenase [Erysipelotrichaceae bacterium]
MLLKDKVAIVTGGTRGIGYAIVKTFLQNGAKVAILGSKKETVDSALENINNEVINAQVIGLYPNLNDIDEVESAFKEVVDKWGSLDILINNAGISARESLFDYEVKNFEKIMDLNVTAAFICSKVAAKYMKEQGHGVINNTSSMVSIYGQRSGVGYPTSKFAINGMTKSLAQELAPLGIRVNAVAPGVTATDMVNALPEDIVKRLVASIPLGRVGQPEDIANAFLYLSSDMASYVTGVILSVDGLARN